MEPLYMHTKKVADLLHVSERQAQRILQSIRKEINKRKGKAITIREFCEYKGFDEDEVRRALMYKNNFNAKLFSQTV